MNQSDKINQLRNILLVMEDKKQKDVVSLNNIKLHLQKRMESLQKLTIYKSEYQKKLGTNSATQVPSLLSNYEQFIRKLDTAIKNEESCIEEYEHRKIEMISLISQQDQKIEAIQIKLNDILKAVQHQMDTLENSALNELYTQQKNREKA